MDYRFVQRLLVFLNYANPSPQALGLLDLVSDMPQWTLMRCNNALDSFVAILGFERHSRPHQTCNYKRHHALCLLYRQFRWAFHVASTVQAPVCTCFLQLWIKAHAYAAITSLGLSLEFATSVACLFF